MTHLLHTLFPFSFNEIYKAVFIYLVLHRGHSFYKKIQKLVNTERRKIIRAHIEDSHTGSLKTCTVGECLTLSSLK